MLIKETSSIVWRSDVQLLNYCEDVTGRAGHRCAITNLMDYVLLDVVTCAIPGLMYYVVCKDVQSLD